MHLIASTRSCIDSIIQVTGPGMKSMILDDFTTGVIGSCYSRSGMLLREIYLLEYIDTIFESPERLNHMKCIVLLRPSRDNVERLCRELERPHYRTYYIFFTCRLGQRTIEKVAEADETEVVRCIRELPLDFQAITSFLFTVKLFNKTYDLDANDWQTEGLNRSTDGLVSLLVALQIYPLIRYQTQSSLCKLLAERVGKHLDQEARKNKQWRQVAQFDVNSLLIIIDRRSDLITPIVNKWTYYPMLHELFGIHSNNRINLVDVPNRQAKDPKEMLISVDNDQFFEENYYKNYGELGQVLRMAVEDLKTVTKSQNKVESIDDMRRFIDEYPETRRYASNIHSHVFIMSELSRLVTAHHLMTVSECEQEIACSATSGGDTYTNLKQLVASDMIRPIDALRLACLYAVCAKSDQKTSSNLKELMRLLKNRKDIKQTDVDSVNHLRKFALSKPKNPLDDTVQHVTKMIIQRVKGVDNVLTQYKPSLSRVLDDLHGAYRLKEIDFAFSGERYKEEAPKRIIIFFVGGLTYDEAMVVDRFNRSHPETKVIIGGTSIHNFKTFKEEVQCAIQLHDRADS